MGTPDGQQYVGFPLFAEALRQRLGFTFTGVKATDLAGVERAALEHAAAGVDAAVLMVHWGEPVDQVVGMLRRLREAKPAMKLIYLDYFAPTCSPHFGVLPFVDCYAKRQVLRDLGAYQNEYLGGYQFAEFMAKRFEFDLKDWHFGSRVDPAHAHKIVPAWNLGVTSRYRKMARVTNRFAWAWRARPIEINRRLGMASKNQTKEWYQAYRVIANDAVAPLAKDFRCSGVARVSTQRYYLEMAASKIVFSPFGWGELCFRDYEAVACGALLVKPSMEHLKTSPDIFVPGETYVSVAWDLSDLQEKCRYYLAHPREAARIALNAQRVFMKYFDQAEFVDDIARIVRAAYTGSSGSAA